MSTDTTTLPSPARLTLLGRTTYEWFIGLPTITLLILVLVIGTGEMLHGQLLRMGEAMFGDPAHKVQYFMLRADPVKPACDANMDIEATVAQQVADAARSRGDVLDDLFSTQQIDPVARREALTVSLAQCRERHALYERVVTHLTPAVVAYRTLETSFFGLFQFGTDNRPLILLLLMGVTILATTMGYHHISLVAPRFPRDFKVQAWTMLAASSV